MNTLRVLILGAFVTVLATPWIVRALRGGAAPRPDDGAPTLVIVTPHVEQIREEFARGFDRWHRRVHGSLAHIDWRTPGGTSEITKQLKAQGEAAVRAGAFTLCPPDEPGGLPQALIDPARAEMPDLFFGGGSFEHAQCARGIEIPGAAPDGGALRVRLARRLEPDFTQSELDAIYPDPLVGVERLYDPDRRWFGTALSTFGIVLNRPLHAARGLREPRGFEDLTRPEYFGLLALADPRQSGAVASLYESILNAQGWDAGWATLVGLCANARSFAASSTQPPMDVSQGDALAGVAIDFYGRGQAQSLVPLCGDPDSSRLGYVEPIGSVAIDPDPVTIINGSRHPELASRFVRYVLSEEGQALWQLPPTGDFAASADNPPVDPAHPQAGKMGPDRERLRRMCVRASMYRAPYGALLTDKTNPFEIAGTQPKRGWRAAVGVVMGAWIDSGDELRAAQRALHRAAADPGFPPQTLATMRSLMVVMPMHTLSDGTTLPLCPEHYDRIARDSAGSAGPWSHPLRGPLAKMDYARQFRANFQRIVEMGPR